MKKSALIKAASMTLGLAALVAVQSNGGSRDDDRGRQHGHRITANAGSTFTLLPRAHPASLITPWTALFSSLCWAIARSTQT